MFNNFNPRTHVGCDSLLKRFSPSKRGSSTNNATQPLLAINPTLKLRGNLAIEYLFYARIPQGFHVSLPFAHLQNIKSSSTSRAGFAPICSVLER